MVPPSASLPFSVVPSATLANRYGSDVRSAPVSWS
jgi:hypothetical protein